MRLCGFEFEIKFSIFSYKFNIDMLVCSSFLNCQPGLLTMQLFDFLFLHLHYTNRGKLLNN